MRKLVVFVFLCIAVIFSFKEAFFKKDNVQNSFMLCNIEALAADNESSGRWNCHFTGSVDCPISSVKVKYVYGGYSLE